MKKQVVAEGALEVAEDLLHSCEMGLPRVMHVEAHLLDRVGDIKPGESKVLESPGQAAVGGRVTDGGARVGGYLGLSVDRHGAGLAVAHASVLEDIPSVLTLVEEKVVDSLLHHDVEEVAEGTEVLHGELLLESCSDTLEQLRARGSEDDVIDVEEQVRNIGAAAIDEQRGVRLGLYKAKGHQVGGKAVVPSSRLLLQTVERLMEPAHQVGVDGVDKSCGLGAVDRLRESVVKESVLDVELVHGPTSREH
jgi:hypothetical protein